MCWDDVIPIEQHPLIHSRDACMKSILLATSPAKKHDTRLHVLHISTAKECALFESVPVAGKHIRAAATFEHGQLACHDVKLDGSVRGARQEFER